MMMMLPKIIFCTAVSAATLAVILLALISPSSINKKTQKSPTRSWLALSLYIQHPQPQTHTIQLVGPLLAGAPGALVFHHTLTAGPQNSSQAVGRAQGFVIPTQQFSHSDFNIIYLTIDSEHLSGGLSINAKNMGHKAREEVKVVGGTGSFAFARGTAVFKRHGLLQSDGDRAMYHVKLRLRFPDHRIQNIPR
ncbi:hypothetical protein ACLOJK_041149 [Asimina triloba]